MDNILRHIAITVVAVVVTILCVLSGTDIVFAQGVTYIKEGQTYVVKSNQWETNDDFSIEYQFDSPTGSPMVFVWAKRPDNAIDTLYAYSLEPFNVSANLTSGQSGVSAVSSEADLMNSSYTSGYELYYRSLNFVMYSSPLSTYEFNWTPSDCVPYYYYEVSDSGYWKEVCDSVRNLLSNGDTSGFDCTYSGISEEGSKDNPIVDESIGYLQIAKANWLNVVEPGSDNLGVAPWFSDFVESLIGVDLRDDTITYFWDGYYHITWKNKTSGGQSLTDFYDKYTSCNIQWKVECLVTDNDGVKWGCYGNQSEIQTLSNSGSLKVHSSKIIESIPDFLAEFQSRYTDVGTNYTIRFYLRPVFTKSGLTVIPDSGAESEWTCGGWKYIDIKWSDGINENTEFETGGGYDDENGNFVEDDSVKNNDDVSGDTYHGEDMDEVMDEIDNPDTSNSGLDTALNTLSDYLKLITNVPKIMAVVFSFLPPWVLGMTGLFFLALYALILYKLIRG